MSTKTKGKTLSLALLLVCAALGAYSIDLFEIPDPRHPPDDHGEVIDLYASATERTLTIDVTVTNSGGGVVHTTSGRATVPAPYLRTIPVPRGERYTAVLHAGVDYTGSPIGISCHIAAGGSRVVGSSDMTTKRKDREFPDVFCRGTVVNA